MLKHRGIVNYVTAVPDNILMHAMAERGHVLTAVTTFSFDFSIKEWGGPLFNGLTLSVASDEEINDANSLAARMKATGIDVFGCWGFDCNIGTECVLSRRARGKRHNSAPAHFPYREQMLGLIVCASRFIRCIFDTVVER